MNLFHLDENIDKNAEYHVDSHIVKMPTEATQMLTTAIWVDKFLGFIPRKLTKEELGIINEIKAQEAAIHIDKRNITRFLPTHPNHPCSIWVRSSNDNFDWTYNYVDALNSEYRYRYRRDVDHKSFEAARNLPLPQQLKSLGITERPICMPEEYIQPGDSVASYRMYYMIEKADFAVWKRREKPPWWNDKFVEYDFRDPHEAYLNTVKAPTNRGKPHSEDYVR
jgi:hypothetical protein